jgi:hypothetical protein
MVRLMTGWADLVVGDLVGGISQALGTAPPLTREGPLPSDANPRGQLTIDERAALTYMGINPDTAPLNEINKALGGLGKPPLPTDSTAAPQAPPAGTSPMTGVGDPGTPSGQELSGAAAEAVKSLDAALASNRTALNEADDKLAEAILNATSSSDQGKARLGDLQRSVIDQVHKLGSTLDTPAGQQQLADYLQSKTSEILDVVKNAGLDSASQAAVMDGLSARYDALSSKPTQNHDDNHSGAADTGGPAGRAPGAANSGAGTPDVPDPLLNGLASNPLLGGLGSMLAPGMGALSGIPGTLGGMMPFGGGGLGGGLPLGEVSSGIGSAVRDAKQANDPDGDDLRGAHTASDSGALKDPPPGDQSQAHPAGTQGAGPEQQANAAEGQVNPPAPLYQAGAADPPDTTVKLPSGATVVTDTAATAKAGRSVLDGASIEDAYRQAGLNLSPPGSPVTAPVSPSRLVFGDIGQYTDHRVMALGDNKVWVNGKETPLEELETGPNFLGWERPTAPAGGHPVVTASATSPATQSN